MASDPTIPVPALPLKIGDASLSDLEAIRLLLRGSSCIDWHRLSFTNRTEVDRFLRVNEFDPERPGDMDRLEQLREDAVEFLMRNFGYRIPDSVAGTLPVPDLFLLASLRGKRQVYACMVLKVMHVMHHLAGRELLFKLPIADDEVFGLVEAKVVKVVDELRAAGYPILEFAWSRKERDSVVTKLLAKKESIAANVFDKLRFRLTTRTAADLPAVLLELLHRLVPFNYVLPGETVNGIVHFRELVKGSPSLSRYAEALQEPLEQERAATATPANEFSGPTYRVINFVADLPVRIDEYLNQINDADDELGSVIFVLTEFQIIDAETAAANEQGENSHSNYKARQHQRVMARLSDRISPVAELDDDSEDAPDDN